MRTDAGEEVLILGRSKRRSRRHPWVSHLDGQVVKASAVPNMELLGHRELDRLGMTLLFASYELRKGLFA